MLKMFRDRTLPANPRVLAQAVRHVRRRAGAFVVDNFFRGIASIGKLHPHASPERHRIVVERDLAYLTTGSAAHRLDVYRPSDAKHPLPVVLYVHGGGFRILSKDTHWIMGLAFAREGYVVFNINYRLAPWYPFPAALEDVCAAYAWTVENAAHWGGDRNRIVLAGESAGANLVTALSVATAYRRPEPWTQAAWNAPAPPPRATIAACGFLQVTDPARFVRRKPHLSQMVYDRIQEASEAYVGPDAMPSDALALADPLLVLESGARPERPLPAFFAPVGTGDPLLDDTRRLKAALDRLGVRCEARYYERELHAFHAVVFRPNARRCWAHLYGFLEQHVRETAASRG